MHTRLFNRESGIMPDTKMPRSGSMQFWPRKRAKRPYARVRSHVRDSKSAVLSGFAGYKVGMTHIHLEEAAKSKKVRATHKVQAATIIECPPLKICGLVFLKEDPVHGLAVVKHILPKSNDKSLKRKIIPSKKNATIDDTLDYDELRVLVHTQPVRTSVGKKKPEIFEMVIGGSKEDQLAFAKEKLGQEVTIQDVLKPGDVIDVQGISRGKGVQGPVKRFGVAIRNHKSEKVKPWTWFYCWWLEGARTYDVSSCICGPNRVSSEN